MWTYNSEIYVFQYVVLELWKSQDNEVKCCYKCTHLKKKKAKIKSLHSKMILGQHNDLDYNIRAVVMYAYIIYIYQQIQNF